MAAILSADWRLKVLSSPPEKSASLLLSVDAALGGSRGPSGLLGFCFSGITTSYLDRLLE